MSRLTNARQTRFGGYLEDYETGDVFEHWPGKTVLAADDHLFCLLTMAVNPLHVDEHFAATETEFGRTIVVGSYIYSLLLGMSMRDVSGRAIANLGTDGLRHIAPLFHGDTLYGRSEVLSTRPSASRPAAGILTVRTKGTNQSGELVCQFSRSVLLPRRPSAGRHD